MPELRFKFTAEQSSGNYRYRLVGPDSDTPLTIGGYTFEAVKNGEARNGQVTAVFFNVPAGTILPAGTRFRAEDTSIVGRVAYADPLATPFTVCAATTTCHLSNLAGAFQAPADAGLTLSYSFNSSRTGDVKVQILRQETAAVLKEQTHTAFSLGAQAGSLVWTDADTDAPLSLRIRSTVQAGCEVTIPLTGLPSLWISTVARYIRQGTCAAVQRQRYTGRYRAAGVDCNSGAVLSAQPEVLAGRTFDTEADTVTYLTGQGYTLVGAGTNLPPTVANPIPDQTGVVGTAFSYTIPSNTFADSDGTIASIALSGLPAGLTYNAANRTLSGTPSAPGTFTVTAMATDSGGASVTDQFQFTVEDVAAIGIAFADVVFPRQTFSYPDNDVVVRWEFFAPGKAAHLTDMSAGSAADRFIDGTSIADALGVAATGLSQGSSGSTMFFYRSAFDMSRLRARGYTGKVGAALKVRQKSGTTAGPGVFPRVSLKKGSSLVQTALANGVDFAYSGQDLGYTDYTNGGAYWHSVSATESTIGWLVMDLAANTVEFIAGATNPISGPANAAPQVAAPIPDQTATAGAAFTYAIPAGTFIDPDGSIVGVAVSGLPAGLTYNAATRTISGTPTAAGTALVTVTATDNGGATVADQFNIAVSASVNETTTLPAWLTRIGFSAAGATDRSIHLLTDDPASTRFSVEALSGPQPSGGSGPESWTAGSALSVLTQWAISPYTARRPLNAAPGNAGLAGGQPFRFRFWKTQNPTQVYRLDYTVPVSDTAGVVVIAQAQSANVPPVVASAIPVQSAPAGGSWTYTVPAGTFTDANGDTLTYAATQASGAILPPYLTFNAATRTFTVLQGSMPAAGTSLTLRVTATDGGGLSASTDFLWQVQAVTSLATIERADYLTYNTGATLYGGVRVRTSPTTGTAQIRVTPSGGSATAWIAMEATSTQLAAADCNQFYDVILGPGDLVELRPVGNLTAVVSFTVPGDFVPDNAEVYRIGYQAGDAPEPVMGPDLRSSKGFDYEMVSLSLTPVAGGFTAAVTTLNPPPAGYHRIFAIDTAAKSQQMTQSQFTARVLAKDQSYLIYVFDCEVPAGQMQSYDHSTANSDYIRGQAEFYLNTGNQ